ncbi:MAG: hypothetical protein U0520_00920 [Candidatus Saccharimonadales bacterium]
MLSLVDGIQQKFLGCKKCCRIYQTPPEGCSKAYRIELQDQAKERAHLEGYKIALDNIDEMN